MGLKLALGRINRPPRELSRRGQSGLCIQNNGESSTDLITGRETTPRGNLMAFRIIKIAVAR